MATTNWDTAWAVEQSETGAPTGRLVSNAAVDGREGVLQPQDLVLKAKSPATLVATLNRGGCSFPVRVSGQEYQSYIARLRQPEDLTFAAAPSASRSDLVVCVVRNPYLNPEKYNQPPDPYAEKYTYTEVWKNVGAGITKASQVDASVSATALWRVDLPKGAASVTDAMFKDLRNPSNVRPPDAPAFFMDVKEVGPLSNQEDLPQSGAVDRLDKRIWPPAAYWDIPVPSWATSMEAYITFNPRTEFGNTWGQLWTEWNGRLGGAAVFDVNLDPDFWTLYCKLGGIRQQMTAGGAWAIPPEERGTYRRLRTRADTFGAPGLSLGGKTRVPTGTIACCYAIFKQVPSSL